MPGFVKTAKDEELWSKAKEIATQKFGNAKSDSFYAYANTVFHRMKGLDESTPGFINNLDEDKQYETIKKYVLEHPVYNQFLEEEKYSMIEDAFAKYNGHKKEGGTQELLEYISSFGAAGGWGGLGGGLGMGGGYPFSGLGGGYGGGFGMGGLGGGARTEAPKGPYVYGAAGTDQGVDPAFRSDGHPAVVVIPDKKSNYKPWEKTLDAFGNDVADVKRAQTVSAHDNEWDGPVGDVVSALEDMGIDAEQLQHMTQEQMEDLIVKAYKREAAQQQQVQAKQQVSQINSVQNKIQEAFSFDEMKEKFEREGKTQKGRDFLSNSLQQKQATEREEGSRRYKLDHYDIERMMLKRGYTYDSHRKDWVRRKQKIKGSGDEEEYVAPDFGKTAIDAQTTRPAGNQNITTIGTVGTTTQPIPRPEGEPIVAPIKPVEPVVAPVKPKEDLDKLHDHSVKHKIKAMEARFIMGMGHREPIATEYKEDEKTKEKVPVIPDDVVIKQLETLKYTWNPDKLLWLNEHMTLPHTFFDNHENQKTLVARSFLAALGKVNKIHINQTGTPSSKVESLDKEMEAENYKWNAETHHWTFVEPEKLNEADEKNQEEQPPEPQGTIDYNKVSALMYQGRYLLRAFQVNQINQTALNDRDVPLEEYNAGDPTVVKKGKQVQDNIVKNKLQEAGFVPHGLTWVDANKQNRFPDCVEKLGDNEQSFIARGTVAAITNNDTWIAITVNGLDKPTVQAEGQVTPEHVEEETRVLKLEWDDKNKVFVKKTQPKNPAQVAQQAKKESEADLVGLTPERQAFLDRYRQANWNYMSYEDREKYKEYSAERGAMRELGIDPKSWPSGNDDNSASLRKKYIRKYSQNYKFVTDPKTGTHSWVRRDNPVTRAVDMVGLKAAIGTAARSILGTTKGAVAAGGAISKALKSANSWTV